MLEALSWDFSLSVKRADCPLGKARTSRTKQITLQIASQQEKVYLFFLTHLTNS